MIRILVAALKTSGKFVLCGLASFALFGLLLAFFWWLSWGDSASFKTATTLAAAGLSILAGGFLTGKWSPASPVKAAAVWGLLVGLLSFGYIFGIDWKLSIAVPAFGALAGLGGWLSKISKNSSPQQD